MEEFVAKFNESSRAFLHSAVPIVRVEKAVPRVIFGVVKD